jgi:hypothetical protein
MPDKRKVGYHYMVRREDVLTRTTSRRTDLPIHEISSVMNTSANIVSINDISRPGMV